MPMLRVVVTHRAILVGGKVKKQGENLMVNEEDAKVLIGMSRARLYDPEVDSPEAKSRPAKKEG